jgi:hypothetical protein
MDLVMDVDPVAVDFRHGDFPAKTMCILRSRGILTRSNRGWEMRK